MAVQPLQVNDVFQDLQRDISKACTLICPHCENKPPGIQHLHACDKLSPGASYSRRQLLSETHLTDEETETQRGGMTRPRLHSYEVIEPGLFYPKALFILVNDQNN